MTAIVAGSSLDGFYYDPKAGRPDRLRNALRLVAEEIQRVVAWVMFGRGRSVYRCLFVTLTYRANTKGDPRDVSFCLNRVRDWLARQGLPMCPYLWVAELQKRGALHYHLMVWLPRGLHLPKLDRRGWWKHGMTKVETARNPVGYLVKYASKFRPEDIARFRKGTRLYGYGGLVPEVQERVRWLRLSRWVRGKVETRKQEAFGRSIEDRITEQAHDEGLALHLLWPDRYPTPPEPLPECIAERVAAELLTAGRERELVRARRSLFVKVSGGVFEQATGEFHETPYKADYVNGVVHIWPKPEKRVVSFRSHDMAMAALLAVAGQKEVAV